MPRGPFRRFLERSLELLERQAPVDHRALVRAVAPREVAVVVDGEAVGLAFAGGGVAVAPLARPAVELRTSRAAILELLLGGATLLEAILDDRFFLRGAPGDLVAFDEGFRCYLRGAVRAPSFPSLLRAYRAGLFPNQELDDG